MFSSEWENNTRRQMALSMKNHYCKNCKKELKRYNAIRCHSCENKRRFRVGILSSDIFTFKCHAKTNWNRDYWYAYFTIY